MKEPKEMEVLVPCKTFLS